MHGHQTCTAVPAMRRQIECLRALGGELNALKVNCGSTDFRHASLWSRVAVAGHAQHLPPRCTTALILQRTAVTWKRIAVAYGLYIEYTEVTLGTKNNMKTEYGRIGLRRFWAPCDFDLGMPECGQPSWSSVSVNRTRPLIAAEMDIEVHRRVESAATKGHSLGTFRDSRDDQRTGPNVGSGSTVPCDMPGHDISLVNPK